VDGTSSWTRLVIWPIIVAVCVLAAAAGTAVAGQGRSNAHGNPAAAPGHGQGASKGRPARGGRHSGGEGTRARSRGKGRRGSSRGTARRGGARGQGRRGGSRGAPGRRHRGSAPQGSKSPRAPRRPRGGRSASSPSRAGGPDGKVTICHATGSATNPYVEITVSVNALPAHTRHQGGEDVVNPSGPCNAPAAASAAAPGAAASPPPDADAASPPSAGATPAPNSAAPPGEGGGVRGVETATADVQTAADRGAHERDSARSASSGGLPFTGFAILLLVLVGTSAVLAGAKLRSSQPS
jgi:hypothetical protein